MNKKLTVLAVMLVMAVLSIPAIAQVEQGTGDKAAGGGSELPPPAETPIVDSVVPEQPVSNPEPLAVETPVADSVVPEQPVSSPEPPPPVETPAADSGSSEPPAGGPGDSVGPEQPVEAPPADGGGIKQEAVGDPVIDTGPAEREVEDQKADRDEQTDWDRKVGINQRDRRDDDDDDDDDDCEPGDRGFPFFCDRDRDDDDDGDPKQEIDQEAESGDVDQEVDISLSGDNSNQCVAVLQAANTGNVQNAQGLVQYRSDADDIELEGGGIIITPELVQDCRQIIQQTVVAQRPGAARARAAAPQPVVGRAAGPVVGGARGATISPSRAVPASLGKAAPTGRLTGRLPRTGGIGTASLLTLGIGALLIGGGLLARRLSR